MKFLIEQMLKPLTARLGTTVGATLTTLGVAQPDVALVVSVIPIICGLGIDLITRKVLK